MNEVYKALGLPTDEDAEKLARKMGGEPEKEDWYKFKSAAREKLFSDYRTLRPITGNSIYGDHKDEILWENIIRACFAGQAQMIVETVSVAKSGMSATYNFRLAFNSIDSGIEVIQLNPIISRLAGYSRGKDKYSIKVNGCGFDRIHDTLYRVNAVVFGSPLGLRLVPRY